MNNITLSPLFSNMKPSPMLQMFEAAGKYPNVINLGIGEPDYDTAPDIVMAGAAAGKEGFTHYPPVQGYPDLRNEISKYWSETYGLSSTGDNVIMTIGASQALYLSFQVLLSFEDEIIVTNPCFSPYLQQITYIGAKIVSVPVYEENGFNITAEDLKKYVTPKTKAVLLNSPNNPTGAIFSREEAQKISKVIVENDLILISDEVYEAFIYEGEHVCFASLPEMAERTVTIGSFSKNHCMTGWRIGYAIAPQKIVTAMKVASVATSMGINSMAQKAALYAMQNCSGNVVKMVSDYKERVSYTADRINKIPSLSCIKPKGSFYIFINISKTGMNSVDFCWKLLEEASVVLIPGISFGSEGDRYVRSACTVPIEKLDEACSRIENTLKDLKV